MADENFVRICGFCQKEQGIEKEMKDASKAGIVFSHGLCIRHFEQQMRGGGFDEEKIRKMVDMLKKDSKPPVPDLAEHPDLVKLYKQGIWLPKQLHQTQQPQQPTQPETKPLTEGISLKERFQILSGIRSSIKS